MDAAVVEDADFLVDLNALLASFSDGPVLSDVVVPPPPSETGSPESVNSRPHPGAGLSEIERFLMEDADEAAAAEDGVGEGIGVEEFLDAVFAGGEEESEAGGSTDGSSGKDEEEGKVEVEVEVESEVAGDDPIGRKQRRQMRNRDSAMKSRARKKMYVKDLEMKSKYLEAECRRLSYALQCCAAENMALRQSLLKDRPVGAPTAMMQESAVLMETLPLVSLLWLVGIVCLFLMPGLPNRSPMAPSSLGRDPALVAGKTSSDEPETLELLLHGRRSKGTRARIKLSPLPLLGIATC